MVRKIGTVAVVAAAIAIGTAAPSQAACAGGKQGSSSTTGEGQKLKSALAQLNLSATQKQQIQQIVSQGRAKRTPSTAGKFKGAAKGVVEQIMNVLTPPQKTKLKQLLGTGRAKTSLKA